MSSNDSRPEVGRTGARFGRRHAPEPAEVPPPDDVAPVWTPPEAAPSWIEPEPPDPSDADDGGAGSVRPYVLTRGRTRPQIELSLETLVSAVPEALGIDGPHQEIVELCHRPLSVAEVAALRGVALGVARVLLGDLAVSGTIVVHRTPGARGPDRALLERVLDGLRRL